MVRSLFSSRIALLLLTMVLGGGFARIGDSFSATANPDPAMVFFSANTDTGLSLNEAIHRLKRPAHQRCRYEAQQVLCDLEFRSALIHDAIGDWEDGVENSLLVVIPDNAERAALRAAAAWFGLIADQKAVLAFRSDRCGKDVLVSFTVADSLPKIREALTRLGVLERTILVDGEAVRVLALVQLERFHELVEMAHELNTTLEARRGHTELLSAPTRDEARKRFQDVLKRGRFAVRHR